MIYYLVTQAHAYTMLSFLNGKGKHLAHQIKVLPYEDLFRKKYLQEGVYIFSDIDRLKPEFVKQVTSVWNALDRRSSLPVSVLNHPAASLTRYALLRKLYEAGINPFNVYRADEARLPERYPVFLRRENDHLGSITPLLHNRDELMNTLVAIEESGIRLANILIVEYFETRNDSRVYQKYSAFKLGDHIIANHIFTGYNWGVKGENSIDDTEAELVFLKQNPHVQRLTPIFQLAGIDFGRVDYSMFNENPVIWEINTNPMFMTEKPGREKIDQYFIAQLSKAVVSFDFCTGSDGPILNPIYVGWAKRGQKIIELAVKNSPIPVSAKLKLRTIYKHYF